MERLGQSVRHERDRFEPTDASGTGSMTEILRAWPLAVGEGMARQAWPARLLRDGTLLVHASSSTWAFELGRMAAEILERLTAEAGKAAPPALRFAPGPIPDPTPARPEQRAAEHLAVPPETTAAAAEIAAPIEDSDLREAVARAAAASLASARADRAF